MERKENGKKGKWVKISTARTTDEGSIQYSSDQNLTKAACDALLTKRVNTKELEMMKGFLDARPTLIRVLPKKPQTNRTPKFCLENFKERGGQEERDNLQTAQQKKRRRSANFRLQSCCYCDQQHKQKHTPLKKPRQKHSKSHQNPKTKETKTRNKQRKKEKQNQTKPNQKKQKANSATSKRTI
jgi:hypothetical protein